MQGSLPAGLGVAGLARGQIRMHQRWLGSALHYGHIGPRLHMLACAHQLAHDHDIKRRFQRGLGRVLASFFVLHA
jgi:hypothetical protein